MVLPQPPLTPINFPKSTGGRWITWVSMGERRKVLLWVGVTLQASDSRKNLVALRYEPISRIPGWWAVLPDWADFPPNWATFNLFRLGKLSLGGKFTQSGNAVDNKQTRSACIAAQLETQSRWNHLKDNEILTFANKVYNRNIGNRGHCSCLIAQSIPFIELQC